MWQSHGDILGSMNKTPASQGYRWSTTTWQPQSWVKNKYSLVSEGWWQLLRKWMLKLHLHSNTDRLVTHWQPPVTSILLHLFEWKWCWLEHVGWSTEVQLCFVVLQIVAKNCSQHASNQNAANHLGNTHFPLQPFPFENWKSWHF